MKHKNIPSKDRLIFAMDVPDCDRARLLADELGDAVTFYKIGLELMMSGEYFELLDWMLERDKKVFCDLKFFDIPATVGSAVRQLKDRGASFVTVHGNRSIMEAAAENKGDSLKVLGVTVLTSLDGHDTLLIAHGFVVDGSDTWRNNEQLVVDILSQLRHFEPRGNYSVTTALQRLLRP